MRGHDLQIRINKSARKSSNVCMAFPNFVLNASQFVWIATILTSLLTTGFCADDQGGHHGGGHGGGHVDQTDVQISVKVATTTPTTTPTTTSTSTSEPPTTSPTTTTKDYSDVTIGPSSEVEYAMVLNSSGPAVLDSAMGFSVELIPQVGNGSIANISTQFIYQWMNMANKAMNRTQDKRESKLSLTFYSDKVKAGKYPMTVAAFLKDKPTKLVAFQTHIFQLTEKLNGYLVLQQDLDYQRFPNVFATHKKINLRAKVHDRFHHSPKPSFEYFWYKNGKFIISTETPFIDTKVSSPTNMTVKSVIYLSFDDPEDDDLLEKKKTTNLKSNTIVGDTLFEDVAIDPTNSSHKKKDGHKRHEKKIVASKTDVPFKKGNFDAPALFKDQLTSCTVERVDKKGLSIETDTPATVVVSCLGSPPLSVCLNITKRNKSVEPAKVCKPVKFVNDTTHKVQVSLNTSGWQDVHFFVYNDVSRVVVVQSYNGYNKYSASVLPLTLPLVFSSLGFVIFIIGGVYIMRLRKKPLVEVADFDFHPTLTSRLRDSNSITLSRMFNSLRYFLFAKEKSGKGEINFPPEFSPTPSEFSPTPTDFSRSPLSESFKSDSGHVLYGSL